jgi:hypothetical protein
VTRGSRIFLSLILGALLPTLAVSVASRSEEKPRWTQAVLAPGEWVANLAGPMPTRGVGASGRPIERPTSRHVAFGMAGILATVLVYALSAYLLLTLVARESREPRPAS